jgi:ABC-type branched-subunit amino acid transport system substrate-binding protein
VAPYGAGAPLGWFDYYKQKYPDAISAVGTIVGNQPAAVQGWEYSKSAMQSVGYKVIYEDDFPPAESNFTADVIRMRSAGVKMVYIVSVNAPDLAAFSQEAAQQGWHPEVFASAIGYFGSYVGESGGAGTVANQYVNIGQAMFLGEDAGTVPEVATFDHWIGTAFPSFPIDQFSATSWANTALFVNALKAVGPHLTRAALLAALAQTHTFNDYGMEAPVDVGSKQPSNCYLLLQIRGGKYVKVDDPATGFRCDAPYFHV